MGGLGIHQSKAHKLLFCRQAAEPLSRPPCSHPPTTSESPLPSSPWHLLTPHTLRLSLRLSLFSLRSLPLSCPVWSRCSCSSSSPPLCGGFDVRPPVGSSARHHWIELGRTGPGSTLLRHRREPSGEAGSGTGGSTLHSVLYFHSTGFHGAG